MPKSNNNLAGLNTVQIKSTKKNFFRARCNNYLLWSAIAALLIEMSLGGLIKLPDNFEQIVTAFLNVLVMVGILNNPTTKSQSLFIDEDDNGVDDRLENVN